MTLNIYEGFVLEFVSAREYRPRKAVRCHSPFLPEIAKTPATKMADMLDGTRSIIKFGPKKADLVFTDIDITDANYRILEQIEDGTTPVYIYGPAPASTSLFAPLIHCVGGDPGASNYTGGWAGAADASSRAFVLIPDDVEGGYAQEFDPDDPVILYNLLGIAFTRDSIPYSLKAMYIYKGYENLVENALLGDVTAYMPANWTATNLGIAGAAHGVESDGCVFNPTIPNFWASGTIVGTGEFTSDLIDLPAAQEKWAVSALCQTWGLCGASLRVKWYNAASAYQTTTIVALGGGTGILGGVITRPNPLYVKVSISLVHSCGFTRWSMPQLCDVSQIPEREYVPPMFIGSSGANTTAKIDPAGVYYRGVIGPGREIMAVVGFVTLPWSIAEANLGKYTLTSIKASHSAKQISLDLYSTGAQLLLRVLENAVVLDSTPLSSHTAGESYVFMLTREVGGVDNIEGYIMRVDATSFTQVSGSSDVIYGDFYYVGSNADLFGDPGAQMDALLSTYMAFNIDDTASRPENFLRTVVKSGLQEIWTHTMGRLYHLELDLHRDPHNNGHHAGNIYAYEMEKV